MLNSLVVVAIMALFAWYEVILALSSLLPPRKAQAAAEGLARRSVGRIFSLMRHYCGVRLVYENRSGRALPERFLLVANHQSLMDIPISIALFPGHRLRFVAKKELGSIVPFVSRLLRFQGHAIVKRQGEASEAMRTISRYARRCAREGTCPVIFPEGTRSRDGAIGPFHTAGVRKILAEEALPVVVAAYDGAWRVASLKGLFGALGGACFKVRVLSISQPLSAKAEVLAAIAGARERISDAVAGMA